MNVRTILVPTDASRDADCALSAAVDLAKLSRARIVVLHAYNVDSRAAPSALGTYTLPQSLCDELHSRATDLVQKAVHEVVAQGVEASGLTVSAPAASAIVEEAERLPADLIVMGTTGRTDLAHVLLGSVAEWVIKTAQCPVMTVSARTA